MFPGADDVLYIQQPNHTSLERIQHETKLINTQSSLIKNTLTDDTALSILYNTHNIHTHNTNKTTIWHIYNNTTALYYLIKSLNIHIECEKQLISAIQARFIVEEVEPLSSQEPCMTEGSEYVGRQVRRAFGKTVSVCMYYVYNLYCMFVSLFSPTISMCLHRFLIYIYIITYTHTHSFIHTPLYTVCGGHHCGLVAGGGRGPGAVACQTH